VSVFTLVLTSFRLLLPLLLLFSLVSFNGLTSGVFCSWRSL
jgi:hypothetical protein